MRHISTLLLTSMCLTLPLSGCKANVQEKEEARKIAATETPHILADADSVLGDILVRIYEGSISDGAQCTLSVYCREHSGDGAFAISMLSAEKELFSGQGRLYTLRGENDATIWECRTNCHKRALYFVTEQNGETVYLSESDSNINKDNPMRLIQKRHIPR